MATKSESEEKEILDQVIQRAPRVDGVDTAEEDEDEIEVDVRDWMKSHLDKEVTRLKDAGIRVLVIDVKNTGILREESENGTTVILNRIEANTSFDFNRIDQIMVSEPSIPCPIPSKVGFHYLNVVLAPNAKSSSSAAPSMIIIMPYLYDASIQANDLKEWVFLNNKLERSQHRIDSYV